MGGKLVAHRPLDAASDIQARPVIAAHGPLTAPDYSPEWNAYLSKVNRGFDLAAGQRTAEIALMLAGWFLFGFLLGMLLLA
jgi:hypothetical protein